MPSDQQIDTLLELITLVVNEGKPWKQKRNRVLERASYSNRLALEEFGGWFAQEG